MTPSCTSGVAVFGPAGSESDQASCSLPTLLLSMLVSGEKPRPSCVRRQLSQSFGEGFASISSVTRVEPSGSARSGQRGSSTPGVSGAAGALGAQALLLGELGGRRASRLRLLVRVRARRDGVRERQGDVRDRQCDGPREAESV